MSHPRLQFETLESRLAMAANFELLYDVNQTLVEVSSDARELTEVNGVAYFAAIDDDHGVSLWRTDGTKAGTQIVKTLVENASPLTSNAIRNLTNVNGTLFFTAPASDRGEELWKSDGTAAGTVLVKDVRPGVYGGLYANDGRQLLTNVGGMLFFIANDGVHGDELWKSDGTAAGTVMVKDVGPDSVSGRFAQLLGVNNQLYLRAKDSSGNYSLWRSDGTANGTLQLQGLNTGQSASELASANGTVYFAANRLYRVSGDGVAQVSAAATGVGELTNVGGTLFFRGSDAGGRELWKSDGTAAGTARVKDIRTGSEDSFPSLLTNLNGQLVFFANDGANGRELWTSNGTEAGTTLLAELVPGSYDGSVYSMANVGGTLYFDGGFRATGRELWKSDGTATGTMMVKDIRPGTSPSDPASFVGIGSQTLFLATQPGVGRELWRTDGTDAGTSLVKDIRQWTADSTPTDWLALDGVGYFLANDGAGNALWRTDGTNAGTWRVFDMSVQGLVGQAYNLGVINGKLVVPAIDGSGSGMSLWFSDGTASGSFEMPIRPYVQLSLGITSDNYFTNVNGTLFFSIGDQEHGRELWKSDGTIAGTMMVKDIRPGTARSRPQNLANVNGTLYFRAVRNDSGYELWKSDGTEAGTIIVRDINPGSGSSSPGSGIRFNGRYYFTANDGVHGIELWSTDGTAAGTTLLKDINVGFANANISGLTVRDGLLMFQAADATSGAELWRSDGTTAGTQRVRDIRPGSGGSNVAPVGSGSQLYTANDGVHGTELWTSDGTEGGTYMLLDLLSGSASSSPGTFQRFGERWLFTARTIAGGNELWTTDGTAAGTASIRMLTGSSILILGVFNDEVYFRVSGSGSSMLWKTDGTAAGTVTINDFGAGNEERATAMMRELNGRIVVAVTTQRYGRELWVANPATSLPGDYTHDGRVDGADFLAWQRGFGSAATPVGSGADGDGDGTIGAGDLDVWMTGFGAPQSSVPSVAASLASDCAEPPAKAIADQGASIAAAVVAKVEPVAARRSAGSVPARERDARTVARDALFAMGDVSAMFAIEDETAADWLARRRRR